MILLTLSVVIGIMIGFARGGRFSNIRHWSGRLAPAVAGGLILLAAPSVWHLATGDDLPGGIWVYLAGLALLVMACAANAGRIKGSIIIGIGLFLNFIVAATNGAIPVSEDALRAADDRLNGPGQIVIDGGLWQLEDDDTMLGLFGDVIPISWLNDVTSFGDLIALAGVCVLTQNLMLKRRREGISVDDFLADTAPLVDLRDIVDVRQPVTAGVSTSAQTNTAGVSTSAQTNTTGTNGASAPVQAMGPELTPPTNGEGIASVRAVQPASD